MWRLEKGNFGFCEVRYPLLSALPYMQAKVLTQNLTERSWMNISCDTFINPIFQAGDLENISINKKINWPKL